MLTGAPAGHCRAGPPPLNFSFHGFSRKSGWFAEDACGSRRGVFVIGLARFPERDDALKRK
jgi:hypothetical protein